MEGEREERREREGYKIVNKSVSLCLFCEVVGIFLISRALSHFIQLIRLQP